MCSLQHGIEYHNQDDNDENAGDSADNAAKKTPEPQGVQSSEAGLLVHTSVAGFEAVQVWCPHSGDGDNGDDGDNGVDGDDSGNGDDAAADDDEHPSPSLKQVRRPDSNRGFSFDYHEDCQNCHQ